ncbi:MAG TPA: hypothetical protein EYG63_02510 [Gammaproteobacteria bacterium]|nr:hypothetical protein [Gammaproteobacteria bacterium]
MKLRKSESSPLQLHIPMENTESVATENDTDKQLLKLDEVDLLDLIYNLKYNLTIRIIKLCNR